jgi:mevalonate kinase
MRDESFYGHGKLLLTGEYFVLEGALALALPTSVGQSLKVKYRHSHQPTLKWTALDHLNNVWFQAEMELWHFKALTSTDHQVAEDLKKILDQVRRQNPHFLRDELEVLVETKLEFPREWGLGSSSSLLYNIAQWAYVGPFELAMNSFGGSGYDIACAQSMGPIHYQLENSLPRWKTVDFNPSFHEHLYLLYLGRKKSTREAVGSFKSLSTEERKAPVEMITSLTREMTATQDLRHFNRVVQEHELLVSKTLKIETIKDSHFSDFWGEVKSLGAWGGDFALVSSERSFSETREYFSSKGLDTLISYRELICSNVVDTSHVSR